MPALSIQRLYVQLAALVESKLWARVLVGLFFGVLVGLALSPATGWLSERLAKMIVGWLALPGDLFLRLVQMVMIPLVLASIVQGIAGDNGGDRLAKLGARLVLYFVATTLVAIVVGAASALLLRPGRGRALAHTLERAVKPAARAADTLDLPSLISGLLPTNPLASMLSGEMLSVVIFAVIVGAALASMERARAEPLIAWFFSMQEICMTVTRWAMKLAPFAVFGLMARAISNSGLALITGISFYMLTVIAALLVILVLYSVVLASVGRVSPRVFFAESRDTLLLAFSVASSAAVMPLTMKTAEEKLHVPADVTRFVVPVGAIMNMNGTAAYQAIATVFLAQSYGMELALPTLGLIVVTTAAASIGTPSAPGAGIVILASVLASAGIPAEGISLIMGVDYLLGMCRTSVNVAGDLTACVVFARSAQAAPAGATLEAS